MKTTKLLTLILGLSVVLNACNSGSTTYLIPPATAYTFNSLNGQTLIGVSASTGSCSKSGGIFNAICSAGAGSVTFSSGYVSSPASYLVIPTQLPVGVTIQTSGTCGNIALVNYDCVITVTSIGAASGATVSIPINGSLGESAMYSVAFQ